MTPWNLDFGQVLDLAKVATQGIITNYACICPVKY